MGSIQSRLRRLEERRYSGHCPGCGLPPDGPGHIVHINEERPEESFKGDPDERCGSCGRHLYCVIRVVYEDANEEDGGGGYRWP